MSIETQAKIGKLLDKGEKRDAIHIAVLPVVCDMDMKPGSRVAVELVGDEYHAYVDKTSGIGVLDPFLSDQVTRGSRCYVFIDPLTVVGMRHDWSHPALEVLPRVAKAKAEMRITEIAEANGMTFDLLMEAAREWVEHGEVYTLDDSQGGLGIPSDFWDHYEVLTGMRIATIGRENFLDEGCGC